jgi:hypothetical protein
MTGNKNLLLLLGKDKGLLATLIGSIFSAAVLVMLIITIGKFIT